MVKVFDYYTRAQGLRGRIVGLPAWARSLILIAGLPGVVADRLVIARVAC
jgi:hypothetical protein